MTTALLIIDVQRALCTGEEAAFDIDRVIERINAVAAQARSAGTAVIFIQHEEREGSLEFESEGWQLARGLATAPADLRVRKTAPDSFHETNLRALLQERGTESLIVCGLQTDCCVNATVRRAMALGYNVQLVADAHSTVASGNLSAAQIIDQHNSVLADLTNPGSRVTVTPARDVRIQAS